MAGCGMLSGCGFCRRGGRRGVLGGRRRCFSVVVGVVVLVLVVVLVVVVVAVVSVVVALVVVAVFAVKR